MKTIRKGDTVIEWYGDDIKKMFEAEKKQALYESGIEVLGRATLNAPVDTGNLRSSLDFSTGSKDNVFDESPESIEVGTAVHYAVHVEFGTRKMNSQPFLRPALDSSISRITQFFANAIERSMAKGGGK